MFRTFNMGVGLAIIVGAAQAEGLRAALEEAGEEVIWLGRLEKGARRTIIEGVTGE